MRKLFIATINDMYKKISQDEKFFNGNLIHTIYTYDDYNINEVASYLSLSTDFIKKHTIFIDENVFTKINTYGIMKKHHINIEDFFEKLSLEEHLI
jgi:hypothetical protein